MNRIIANTPRNVLISLAVIFGAFVVFGAAFVLIGGGLERAIAQNAQLRADIEQGQTGILRARDDYDYVQANLEKYEALIKSDRLVPHTRRAAVVELQRLAQQRGLTTMNFTFDAVAADAAQASQQPANAPYRLSVEYVELKVGAPLDGVVYGFISDITEQFPGAAIVDSFSLTRGEITDAALTAMSEGRESGLATGTIGFLWRTAQAQEKEEAGGAK